MAAIDIDMSEFTQKTTLASTDFITGTLADGSAVKIKVSDIATVVAAVIGLGNFKVRKVQTSNEGGSVYYGGPSNSSLTYVVDASDRTKYILSHTYYNIDRSGVVYQTVISNNGLSFGASNNHGTQVINGTTNDVIFYIMYFV